jgi:hypothetical protein
VSGVLQRTLVPMGNEVFKLGWLLYLLNENSLSYTSGDLCGGPRE